MIEIKDLSCSFTKGNFIKSKFTAVSTINVTFKRGGRYAILRFENARIFAAFHTGIPTPVSMGDAMLIL